MNMTFSLDDELVAAAKVLAARQNTSVNALVRGSLEHQVALSGSALSSGTTSGVLDELLAYSLGRRPRATTMEVLGIDDFGSLVRLLNAAGLPQPMVPLRERERMMGVLVKVLADANAS